MVHQLVNQVVGNVCDFVVLVEKETDGRVVLKRQNTCVRDFPRKELFWPEDVGLGCPWCLVAVQAVDEHDTIGWFLGQFVDLREDEMGWPVLLDFGVGRFSNRSDRHFEGRCSGKESWLGYIASRQSMSDPLRLLRIIDDTMRKR
jgi:hypothetical protein